MRAADLRSCPTASVDRRFGWIKLEADGNHGNVTGEAGLFYLFIRMNVKWGVWSDASEVGSALVTLWSRGRVCAFFYAYHSLHAVIRTFFLLRQRVGRYTTGCCLGVQHNAT